MAPGRSSRPSGRSGEARRSAPSERLPCGRSTFATSRHIHSAACVHLQAAGALVHENADGTSAAVHSSAEAYLAEFREKVGKGALTYEDGWVEVMTK